MPLRRRGLGITGDLLSQAKPPVVSALVQTLAPPVSLWAHLGLNQGPLACEASALPLSYAP